MNDSTRRGFLVMTGAGAAAVGAAVIAPSAFAGADSERTPVEVDKTGTAGGPVVAYVHDVTRGEVSLMVGEREVIVHDRDLVNRLVRASS